MTRILVVGGAGVFGSRLVERLAATIGADVIVAGRDAARAGAAAAALQARYPAARIEAWTLDARALTPEELRSTGAAVLVDAAAGAAGVVAISGASSTPALSHAAVDRPTAGCMRQRPEVGSL